jgi:Protein of unknown function (DUF1592)/Protein of unknown function (DUF1588)/Protein of unknown function (DUF1585)/Protein of unknown function (DUF1587)
MRHGVGQPEGRCAPNISGGSTRRSLNDEPIKVSAMNSWRLVFAATVLTGCSTSIDAPSGTGAAAGTGRPGATGSGATGSGATGSGATGSGATGSGATGSGATGSGATGSGATGSGGTSGSVGTGGTGTSANCTPGVATTSQIPRLTNDEYDRTIRDLLGVTALTASAGSTPSNLLATDQSGGLTDVGWAAYKTVGEDIAEQVMADATLKTNFITCDPSVGTCLHDTAVAFGRKAFRRPLTTDEVAAFDTVIAAGPTITPTGAPAEVAEALLYMFLISPSFIQREELQNTSDGAGHLTLSPYEVASRLSYTLWGSTPDDTLSQAADSQQLGTQEQILTQAQRMVADPRARDMTQAFHRFYMLMGLNTRWDNTNKDPTLYPAFNASVVPLMQQETEMFFDNIVFAKNGTFNDLLTSTTAFVSAATAPFYGLDPSKFGAGLTETTLDANHPGFLTRLGFLNAYSGYTVTSPILRGAFITKQILGIAIGAPPPGAEQTQLPDSSATLNTNRLQYAALTSGPTCVGCHSAFINPPGFALEAFNTVGTWQTVEATTGAPIDTTADIAIDATGTNTVHVTGPADLMAVIAAAPGAKTQYASQWVSFAYQRDGDPNDACDVQQLAAKMTTSGYTVLNLLTDLTQTLSFRVRVAGQ